MTAVLRCAGVRLTHGGRHLLDGVDLEVSAGETVALLGPNGAGKSTLLAVLAGLTVPSAGAVQSAGRVAAALQSPALADRSALHNVELALRWWGSPRAGRAARARAALAATGAAQLADRPARALSGGEARRVHLARALAVDAAVLLLDEPFAGLDPGTRADLLADSVSALRAPGRATVVVVHDRAEAWALADRVVVLLRGRVAADGPVREVLETPPSEEVAAFVGFDGRVEQGDEVLRLRSNDVAVDARGSLRGTVLRRVPLEDGVRLEVRVPGGLVPVVAARPAPDLGDPVVLRVRGGTRFPLTAAPPPALPSP